MKRLAALLLCALSFCQGAWAQGGVTRDTYLARHTEVDGQCLFELEGFTLDVYQADFARDQSLLIVDVYPSGAWSENILPQVKLDGAPYAMSCQLQLIEGAQPVYAYTLTGPGPDSQPQTLTLGFPKGTAQVKLRREIFGFDQSAYYLEYEVTVAEGAYEALKSAGDLTAAARSLLPAGAQLLDCALEEKRAGIEYRLNNTHCLVDYFADGHVEKAQRWDGDWDIVLASTLSAQVEFKNIARRWDLGRTAVLRPRGIPLQGVARDDGMRLRLEGYHLDDGLLMVDWTASAERPLYLQVGNLFLDGTSLDAYNRGYEGSLTHLVALNQHEDRYTYEGTSIVDLEELPGPLTTMSLTIYFVEAAAPIVDWPSGPVSNVPMLLKLGHEYAMIDSMDDEGATGAQALDQRFQLAWEDEPAYVRACQDLGFTRLVGSLTLSFPIEPQS